MPWNLVVKAVPVGSQGGCGWKGKALTRLSGSPTACVVALAWSGPALQVDVVAVCSAIPLKLDLKQAFPGQAHNYQLIQSPHNLSLTL